MSISKEAIEAAQRAFHEMDEGGEPVEKCWEAALQAAKSAEQPDGSAKAYDVWWERFYAEHRETPTSLEAFQAGWNARVNVRESGWRPIADFPADKEGYYWFWLDLHDDFAGQYGELFLPKAAYAWRGKGRQVGAALGDLSLPLLRRVPYRARPRQEIIPFASEVFLAIISLPRRLRP